MELLFVTCDNRGRGFDRSSLPSVAADLGEHDARDDKANRPRG
jgi:hypothetical protein